MFNYKGIVGAICIVSLCMTSTTVVHADEIDKIEDTQEKIDKLEKEEKETQTKKKDAQKKLDKVTTEIEELYVELGKVYDRLEECEVDLAIKQGIQDDQYEAMKQRIQFVYENGSQNSIWEVLLKAKSISDLLNKVEYVQEMTQYDNNQLEAYKENTEKVEKQRQEIEEETVKLTNIQNELEEKQLEAQALVDEIEEDLDKLNESIKDSKEDLEKLIKMAEEAAKKRQEAIEKAAQGIPGDDYISGEGIFSHPMPDYKRISSGFGYRDAPLAGASTNHKGVDFAAPTGTPIYAPMDGTVVNAKYSGNAGNLVTINHGDGLVTLYMHTSQMFVKPGDKVKKGQNIAACGTTGNSTGPHLHFEVRYNGTPVNPMNYL